MVRTALPHDRFGGTVVNAFDRVIAHLSPRVSMLHHSSSGLLAALAALPLVIAATLPAAGQDRLPWERTLPAEPPPAGDEDTYRPRGSPRGDGYGAPRGETGPSFDSRTYRAQGQSYATGDAYRPAAPAGSGYGPPSGDVYRPPVAGSAYGEPYPPPREPYERDYGSAGAAPPYAHEPRRESDGPANGGYYSQNEISAAGHGFFGSVSRGLASVIEYTYQKAGRPNGYILGEDAGGAFIAGLRYGEGRLYTKDAGSHKVYWQGPSLGYDVGAEGSKTMVLVYNLRDPSDLYHRFGGVQGTAYLVGGVSVQFQKYGDVILAPIRAGVGLRLGANVGYLKYTRSPTWNPF